MTDPAAHDPADPAPLEPPRPEDYECCGNGCEPCVFDLHAQAVEMWRADMKAWRERQAAHAAGSHTPGTAGHPGWRSCDGT